MVYIRYMRNNGGRKEEVSAYILAKVTATKFEEFSVNDK